MNIRKIVNVLTLRHDPMDVLHTFPRLKEEYFKNTLPKVDVFHLEDLIKQELKRMFDYNRPKSVAVPLSGGVDSTLIAQLVSEVKPKSCKLHLVSMGFGHSSDERDEAERIADEIGKNEFHGIVVPNILKTMQEDVGIVNEPRWNTYYRYVVDYIKNDLKTNFIITGDGGDELFGGYTHRYPKFLNTYQGTFDWDLRKAIAFMEATFERDYVSDQAEMFGERVSFSWSDILDLFKGYFKTSLDPLNQFFIADFNSKLVHDYVPTNTAFYRHYHVMAMSPMLAYDVIRYACSISPAEKYSHESKIGKLPLRAILVSKGLSKFMLPQKTGYGTDLVNLWQTVGRQKASILIGEPLVVKTGIINRKWIDKHLDPEQADVRYINKLLQVTALEYYLRNI